MFCAETLSYAHGRYTSKTITRAGKIVGALGKALDKAYHKNVCDTDVNESFRHRYDYAHDVRSFCVEYRKDGLFDVVPGRQHSALPNFTDGMSTILKPSKLKSRLLQYSEQLDRTQTLFK